MRRRTREKEEVNGGRGQGGRAEERIGLQEGW